MNSVIKRKRSRKLYLLSIINSIYRNHIYKNIGYNEYQKYLGLSKKYEGIAWLLVPLLPCWIFARFIKALFILVVNRKVIHLKVNNYFLSTSIALSRVSKHANMLGNDYVWLERPFADTKEIDNKFKVRFYNLISLQELIACCLDSCIVSLYSLRKYGLKYIFDNKYSLDWFIYFYMTCKIPDGSNVCFCNQQDKWVPLLDSIDGCKKVFIQHGTEMIRYEANADKSTMKYLSNLGCWVMDMPYKYKNVDLAYVFTHDEFLALNAAIFRCSPECCIIGYEMKLTNISTQKNSVLIVGYFREYGEYEKRVVDLLKNEELDIFIKNHPTVDVSVYSIYDDISNIHIINEPVFPKVDLVISYESTLALEYESYGIKVIYYNDIISNNFVDIVYVINNLCSKHE